MNWKFGKRVDFFKMSEVLENGQAKVLVADDDPAILRLVKAIVEKEGYEVITARDGKEAYKVLQTGEPFVAAIFDVVMPYIQGTELVRYMQSEKRLMKIPVIMMTAEQNSRLSSDSFAAGAVAFLPKPFTNAQLKTMLRMFIRQSNF
jgi:CheY-like chemotaxis protein